MKDIALRLFWTAVAAAGGAVASVPVLDIGAAKAAGMAAFMAVVNLLTLIARSRTDASGVGTVTGGT